MNEQEKKDLIELARTLNLVIKKLQEILKKQ